MIKKSTNKNGAQVFLEKTEAKLQKQASALGNTKATIFNLLEDIHLEKSRSQSLTKELGKFRLAAENSSDHISITDPHSNVIYWNNAAEKITGYEREEMIGRKSEAIWLSEGKKEHKKLLAQVKAQKIPLVQELNTQRKNGKKFIAELQILPILDEKKKIIFYVEILRDITRLKEIDKMKSEFISVASHQLRTPLSAIKWFTEILASEKPGTLTDTQKEYLEQIKESNERMVNLVDKLLDISHIENDSNSVLKKNPLDVMKIFKTIMKEQLPSVKAKKIEINYLKKIPLELMVPVDGEKIAQVLQNFISNAIKYALPNTKINILIEKNERDMFFSIQDFGLGISKKEQKHIFEKFFRTENAKTKIIQGSGLGLYIAKYIIEEYNGKIGFSSDKNKGTTFYFSLPLF